MYPNYSNRTKDSRDYINWNNTRGSSNIKLDRVPHVTNTVNGDKRYYSALDGELYFGNIYIDEVTNINWQMSQQSLPIYGYNSYTFDDMAVGNRIIQGQFSINFTEENFLMKLQSSGSFQRVARKKYAPDNKQTTSYSDYRARLHLPVWDNGFDLVIGFGHHGGYSSLSQNDVATFLVLDCCQLTGTMLQLDMNGQPVQQIYTFIARDIKTSKTQQGEVDSGVNTTPENKPDESDKNQGSESSVSLNGKLILKEMNKNNLEIIADSNIKFSGGNAILLLNDVFSDKRLTDAFSLDIEDSGNKLTKTFLPDYFKALKKEIKDKKFTELVGKVKYKYKSNDEKDEINGESDVKLSIEI